MKLKALFLSLTILLVNVPPTMIFSNHSFPSRHTEYEITTHNESVVDITIHNKSNGFPISTDFIIVQYRSSFHDWWYPCYTTSSDDTYFWVDENSNITWHVMIKFQKNCTSHIKLTCYPGSYSSRSTWSYWGGLLQKSYTSISLFLKKIIIDAFGGSSPA